MQENDMNRNTRAGQRSGTVVMLVIGAILAATLSGCGIFGAGPTASKTYIEIPQNTGPTAPS